MERVIAGKDQQTDGRLDHVLVGKPEIRKIKKFYNFFRVSCHEIGYLVSPLSHTLIGKNHI